MNASPLQMADPDTDVVAIYAGQAKESMRLMSVNRDL